MANVLGVPVQDGIFLSCALAEHAVAGSLAVLICAPQCWDEGVAPFFGDSGAGSEIRPGEILGHLPQNIMRQVRGRSCRRG